MPTEKHDQPGPIATGPRPFVREPQVDSFFDACSCSVQYVVSDPSTGRVRGG